MASTHTLHRGARFKHRQGDLRVTAPGCQASGRKPCFVSASIDFKLGAHFDAEVSQARCALHEPKICSARKFPESLAVDTAKALLQPSR